MKKSKSHLNKTAESSSYISVNTMFQTSIPTGNGDDNYKVVSDSDLQRLIFKLGRYCNDINKKFKNIYDSDEFGNVGSYLVDRQYPDKKYYYDNFTPSDQHLTIRLHIAVSPYEDSDKFNKQTTPTDEHISFEPTLIHENMSFLVVDTLDYNFHVDSY